MPSIIKLNKSTIHANETVCVPEAGKCWFWERQQLTGLLLHFIVIGLLEFRIS